MTKGAEVPDLQLTKVGLGGKRGGSQGSARQT